MIKIPLGLVLASGALLLSPCLVVLEIIVVRQAFHHAWWKLPSDKLIYFCGLAVALSLLFGFFIMAGSKWTEKALQTIAAFWILASFWMALRIGVTSLAFFGLGLLLFWGMVIAFTHRELRRSFLDPRISWYQGLPQPISGVKCMIGEDEFRVGRLDREGVFVFRERSFGLSKKQISVHFQFRDKEIACEGRPIRALVRQGKTFGVGFRFAGMTPDARKKLGDLVETLKGEGYV
jgi:hypothetical protein